MREVIRANNAPISSAPISQGHRAGDFIFVSGQGPFDPKTRKIRGNTIEEQTRHTLENIRAILKAAGADMRDVVKVSVILTDVNNFASMNEVYRTFFSEPFPARKCYGAQLNVPGMLVEIDAIAYVGK